MSKQALNIHSWRSPHDSKDSALDVGSMIIDTYDFSYNPESRELEVVKTGSEDRDAYIQSFADECGVYNILAKFSLTGDMSLLNRRPGMYGDFSGMPTDELNPEAASALAAQQLKALNEKYGLSLSAEELAGMSPEVLEKLLSDTIAKLTPTEEKKEGE